MERKPKPPSARGELNLALNALTKERLILSYGVAQTGSTTIEVAIDKGADQAEVLRRVREALPTSFADAQVRTRID
jgi:hypothetical protein